MMVVKEGCLYELCIALAVVGENTGQKRGGGTPTKAKEGTKRYCFNQSSLCCKFGNMAKTFKKKSARKASDIFHNIMQASVESNPAPIKKSAKKKSAKP